MNNQILRQSDKLNMATVLCGSESMPHEKGNMYVDHFFYWNTLYVNPIMSAQYTVITNYFKISQRMQPQKITLADP
jgi:hypothetical protein